MDIILPICAIVPGIWLLIYIYKHDRRDKEPMGLLLKLLLLGVIATVLALIVELILDAILSNLLPYQDGLLYQLLDNFIGVALVEEGFKFIMLKLGTWKNNNFDHSFDGIVYAVFVSMGFAIAENVSYVLGGGLVVALVRAITSLPGHMCFGVLMGVFYAQAKKNNLIGEDEISHKYDKMALWIAVLVHGAYDFIITRYSIVSLAFGIIIVVIYKVCFDKVKVLSNNDEYF